jgi:RNA polymerase sigma-54 factor
MQIQRQSLVQQQNLKMNPQLYQSIKLMEMPVVDLRERIEEELESNPALELLEDKSTVPYEEYTRVKHTLTRASEQASEEHRLFIEGALSRPETLQGHLLWQLQLLPLDEEIKTIAETLIQNLDDDGFHIEKPETLFPSPGNVPPRLHEAIDLVRSLEPAGTCTSGYRESLEVQIKQLKDPPPGIEKVLDDLELVEKEKYSALAKKTGLDEEDVQFICDYIKNLSPFPGRAFASADIRYVIPDLKVVRDGDDFSIILNDEAFPVLGVSKFYEKMENSKEQAAKEFARKNVRDAKLFIQHLNQRNKTLVRVANAVLEFQRGFFLNGPKHLSPLTLADIAKELDVHETTVSRTANGKYMQTDWGIYEIRYFFTNSISGAGSAGSKFSKESVKEIIREIIQAEGVRQAGCGQLSDLDISALLSQKGIALARRTVAKYRKELDMGSSYTRKVKS